MITSYRLGLALVVLTPLFLLLGSGALGIIGDGGREDRWYAGVLVVVIVGSVLARLRAGGMALTALTAAATVVGVAVLAFAAGYHETDGASVPEIWALTVMYAGLFASAAGCFRRAAALA